MPYYARDGARIRYETSGDPGGPAVLCIAPGGMKSALDRWKGAPWDPIARLTDFFVIAMDQRNAGASTGPVRATDGWHTYIADQLGLLDHLGVGSFHALGMCIGGAYVMRLALDAPGRMKSGVMLQPIGLENNRHTFFALYDAWREGIEADHPEAGEADWQGLERAMFGGEFLFSATRDQVAGCDTPLLLLMGNDQYHPQSISREVARIAPDVTFVEEWKRDPDATDAVIQAFLRE